MRQTNPALYIIYSDKISSAKKNPSLGNTNLITTVITGPTTSPTKMGLQTSIIGYNEVTEVMANGTSDNHIIMICEEGYWVQKDVSQMLEMYQPIYGPL